MTKVIETTGKSYIVILTEQTLLELIKATQLAKERQPSAHTALVNSQGADVNFQIMIETRPQSQESLGYKLEGALGDASSE